LGYITGGAINDIQLVFIERDLDENRQGQAMSPSLNFKKRPKATATAVATDV
jgi:hypothetical protein